MRAASGGFPTLKDSLPILTFAAAACDDSRKSRPCNMGEIFFALLLIQRTSQRIVLVGSSTEQAAVSYAGHQHCQLINNRKHSGAHATRVDCCIALLLLAQSLTAKMREIVHIQAGQCGNQIGAKFWEVRLILDRHLSSLCRSTGRLCLEA